MHTGVFWCTASQRLHIQVKMCVTANVRMYFCTFFFTICGIFGEHFSSVIQACSEWRWAGVTVTGRQQPSS